MGKQKKHSPRKEREWGKPPRSGENRFVITSSDARAYQGKIVAVDGFPQPGKYAKVIARADTLEELKRDLRILGFLGESRWGRESVSVLVRPGGDAWCFVSVSKKVPMIILRKGEL